MRDVRLGGEFEAREVGVGRAEGFGGVEDRGVEGGGGDDEGEDLVRRGGEGV